MICNYIYFFKNFFTNYQIYFFVILLSINCLLLCLFIATTLQYKRFMESMKLKRTHFIDHLRNIYNSEPDSLTDQLLQEKRELLKSLVSGSEVCSVFIYLYLYSIIWLSRSIS